MLPYIVTIFLSAFLLFQVQPLLAKAILPWFGGSASVWTVCLMFFQVLLLLGYLYAHATTRHLAPKAQSFLHIGLLAASLLFLPILPDAAWKPYGTEDPTFRIVLLLLVTVGLPYFLLSTTGSLLQAWFVRQRSDEQSTGGGMEGGVKVSSLPSSASVYRLYAVSNAGSLLALLSYPMGVEPYLPTSLQAWVWSGGYLLFALMCGGIAWSARNAAPLHAEAMDQRAEATATAEGKSHRSASDTGKKRKADGETIRDTVPAIAAQPRWGMHMVWALFVFTSTTLLLAGTSHLTQNIAPVPFLWIVPLSLYLLSFIICFGSRTWNWKGIGLILPVLAIGALVYPLSTLRDPLHTTPTTLLFLAGMFGCFVLCHGELARTRPAPIYLTSYYLMISLGGALGGIFVGIVAPWVFVHYDELPLSIALCAAIALFGVYRPYLPQYRRAFDWVSAAASLALMFYIARLYHTVQADPVRLGRNFYGVVHIYSKTNPSNGETRRTMLHGRIQHGVQIYEPEHKRTQPTTYFSPDSGIAHAIRDGGDRPQRVGIIGLGVGTISAYAEPSDVFRFYEINPLVIEAAHEDFAYLSNSQGKIEIVPGDARLSLEREEPQQYDVLAVDAFSSDAIPVHLLTKDAFELYFRHLKPDGILAVHVSNRYLDLKSLVARMAEEMGKQVRWVETQKRPEDAVDPSDWMLLTNRPGFFGPDRLGEAGKTLPPRPGLRVWTDNYSNLFQIVQRQY